MRYLREHGATPVTEVAAAIGQTHSTTSQLYGPLTRAGLLMRRSDPYGRCRSLLSLIAKGRAAWPGWGVPVPRVRRYGLRPVGGEAVGGGASGRSRRLERLA